MAIREGGDNGTPIVAADPKEIIRGRTALVAESVWAKAAASQAHSEYFLRIDESRRDMSTADIPFRKEMA